jgi:hypothetical protein
MLCYVDALSHTMDLPLILGSCPRCAACIAIAVHSREIPLAEVEPEHISVLYVYCKSIDHEENK